MSRIQISLSMPMLEPPTPAAAQFTLDDEVANRRNTEIYTQRGIEIIGKFK